MDIANITYACTNSQALLESSAGESASTQESSASRSDLGKIAIEDCAVKCDLKGIVKNANVFLAGANANVRMRAHMRYTLLCIALFYVTGLL